MQGPERPGCKARLSSRIDQLKDRCSTAPSTKEKSSESTVLLLRAKPVRARDAQMSLIQCKARAKKRSRLSSGASKSRNDYDEVDGVVSDERGENGEDGDGDTEYFDRPLKWKESSGNSDVDEEDENDQAVRSEISQLCSTQEEYDNSDQRFSAQFKTKYYDT